MRPHTAAVRQTVLESKAGPPSLQPDPLVFVNCCSFFFNMAANPKDFKMRYCFFFFFSAGRKKPVSATPKEMEWAQMACHRCLVYLGDLGEHTQK